MPLLFSNHTVTLLSRSFFPPFLLFLLNLSQAPHCPEFHAKYIEFLPLVAQWFIAKREARAADSAIKAVVEP